MKTIVYQLGTRDKYIYTVPPEISVKNWDLMTHIKLMYMLQMKVLSMQFMKEGFIANCGRLIKSKRRYYK